jgi:hypothetical protein
VLEGRRRLYGALIALAALPGMSEAATAPTIDTEDDSLGSVKVGEGRFHPVFSVDLRNGDFARGGYDDDAANLHRLPVHLLVGFNYALHLREDGTADAWVVGASSNGIHSPDSYEVVRPRAWYESNNLIGVVVEPVDGFRIGSAYTIKTSPNAVAGTTHEASVTMAYQSDYGLGVLQPNFAATIHPAQGRGIYTQVGVQPSFKLVAGERGLSLGVPLALGVGWNGFYQARTGTLMFGSAGLSLSHPIQLGRIPAKFQASAVALIRDRGLRELVSADGETSTVVPYVQLGLTFAL